MLTHTQAGYELAERWSDDEAVLQYQATGAYELWRVTSGSDDVLVIDVSNDGRDYEFVRPMSEFELDDCEVTGAALVM